ncbi:glutathione S-transferase-like [Bombus huntii]|uniref:glutathione S-transferase-like n=1 Tax=Bombus huntii TaxID=85661 RepID=UPI0021AAC900|nr:glutathione S-transferase-like [Bombus huntii]
MMASYKLVYFNVMGLGEPIRFLLSYGGVEFQDIRINYSSEEWSNMKSSIPFFTSFPYEFHDLQLYFNVFSATPFGQLPTLEINGKVYSQTLPICRYLAKQFNLLGKTDLDTLQIDAIASALYDFRWLTISSYYRESNPVLKAKKKIDVMSRVFPFYLNKLEDLAKNNGGYLHGNQVSVFNSTVYAE